MAELASSTFKEVSQCQKEHPGPPLIFQKKFQVTELL